MVKKKTLDTQYSKYRDEFKAMRKRGLVKAHQRQLTKKQFKELAETFDSAATARKEAIEYQSKIGNLTKRDQEKLYKQYKAQGYKVSGMESAGRKLSEDVSIKFRSKETMMKGLKANQLIQLLIDSGLSKAEALEEYGY